MYKKQIAFTAENLERIINTIDLDMIYTNHFFDSVNEEISEKMNAAVFCVLFWLQLLLMMSVMLLWRFVTK